MPDQWQPTMTHPKLSWRKLLQDTNYYHTDQGTASKLGAQQGRLQ